MFLLFASSGNAQTPPLDHFNCYFAPSLQQPRFARLQDQFDPRRNTNETIYDLKLALFCNPVSKHVITISSNGNGGGPPTVITHPEAHLAMYLTNPQTSIRRQVPINNQFGHQTLLTGEAELLAVPSGKAPIISTAPVPAQLPAIPGAGVLDHFRCYSASGPSVSKIVLLKDQFFTSGELANVLTPRFFCDPVQTTVLSPNCPTGQLCPTITTPITHRRST
jgi:hypothetical protein